MCISQDTPATNSRPHCCRGRPSSPRPPKIVPSPSGKAAERRYLRRSLRYSQTQSWRFPLFFPRGPVFASSNAALLEALMLALWSAAARKLGVDDSSPTRSKSAARPAACQKPLQEELLLVQFLTPPKTICRPAIPFASCLSLHRFVFDQTARLMMDSQTLRILEDKFAGTLRGDHLAAGKCVRFEDALESESRSHVGFLLCYRPLRSIIRRRFVAAGIAGVVWIVGVHLRPLAGLP